MSCVMCHVYIARTRTLPDFLGYVLCVSQSLPAVFGIYNLRVDLALELVDFSL